MKKYLKLINFVLILTILALGFNFFPTKVAAADVNLITNPSAETIVSGATIPAGWQTESWGTNKTTFAVKTGSAQDGQKSLLTTITSYSSGDAKWLFQPVAATPNTEYIFSDYYKSSRSASVVVRFIKANGSESYLQIGTTATSAVWKKASYNFKTPADLKTLTVLHLIKGVGWLETDNFLLQTKQAAQPPVVEPPVIVPPVVPPVVTSIVPNPSLEESVNNTAPTSWQKENWGTNSATFSYLNSGHTGSRSVKTQITKYTDGDAKWYYSPQSMKPGEYLFSDYYISNVATQAVVWITKTDNTDSYINLKNAPATTIWQKYSDSFTLSADTKLVSVFHIINAIGYLITDDYSVSSYQIQGFSRPLISMTFDDGWEENISTALPVLDQYGYKSTQYYATMYINSDSAKQQIKAVADSGHEIGSHSITHPFLTKASSANLNNELAASKQFLESIVGTGKVTSFATPYGDYNQTVTQAIQKYYQSNRNTLDGWNTKDNFDTYNLRVQNMTNTTTLAEFTSWVNKAQEDKTWLIIVYHRIGANPDQYDATLDNFKAQMNVVSKSGITVKPVSAAIAEIKPQMK